MKILPAVSAVAGSLLLASVAVAAGPGAATDDTAALAALGCEMGRAYARQDLATLDRLNADDYPDYVRQRTAGTFKRGVSTLAIDCEDIHVRLYGDAAVVTGGWIYTAQKPEGGLVRRSRWTSMWTRYPAGWKRHAFQNTWVNPDANQPSRNSGKEGSGKP